jgi:hypothetical protein
MTRGLTNNLVTQVILQFLLWQVLPVLTKS